MTNRDRVEILEKEVADLARQLVIFSSPTTPPERTRMVRGRCVGAVTGGSTFTIDNIVPLGASLDPRVDVTDASETLVVQRVHTIDYANNEWVLALYNSVDRNWENTPDKEGEGSGEETYRLLRGTVQFDVSETDSYFAIDNVEVLAGGLDPRTTPGDGAEPVWIKMVHAKKYFAGQQVHVIYNASVADNIQPWLPLTSFASGEEVIHSKVSNGLLYVWSHSATLITSSFWDGAEEAEWSQGSEVDSPWENTPDVVPNYPEYVLATTDNSGSTGVPATVDAEFGDQDFDDAAYSLVGDSINFVDPEDAFGNLEDATVYLGILYDPTASPPEYQVIAPGESATPDKRIVSVTAAETVDPGTTSFLATMVHNYAGSADPDTLPTFEVFNPLGRDYADGEELKIIWNDDDAQWQSFLGDQTICRFTATADWDTNDSISGNFSHALASSIAPVDSDPVTIANVRATSGTSGSTVWAAWNNGLSRWESFVPRPFTIVRGLVVSGVSSGNFSIDNVELCAGTSDPRLNPPWSTADTVAVTNTYDDEFATDEEVYVLWSDTQTDWRTFFPKGETTDEKTRMRARVNEATHVSRTDTTFEVDNIVLLAGSDTVGTSTVYNVLGNSYRDNEFVDCVFNDNTGHWEVMIPKQYRVVRCEVDGATSSASFPADAIKPLAGSKDPRANVNSTTEDITVVNTFSETFANNDRIYVIYNDNDAQWETFVPQTLSGGLELRYGIVASGSNTSGSGTGASRVMGNVDVTHYTDGDEDEEYDSGGDTTWLYWGQPVPLVGRAVLGIYDPGLGKTILISEWCDLAT